MDSITFTIDKTEIEKIAGKKLDPEVTEEILSIVENDTALWDDIEESIASAVKFLVEK